MECELWYRINMEVSFCHVNAIGLVIFVTVYWSECGRLLIMASMGSIGVVACVRNFLVEALRLGGYVLLVWG